MPARRPQYNSFVFTRARATLRTCSRPVRFAWHACRLANATFTFEGRTYQYLLHPYNETWGNERAVEVPVVLDAVRRSSGRVLEVGNVLSHYVSVSHPVVDKYERAPGVLNQDIESFHGGPFDLIVTISTLEHVGWNRREGSVPERLSAVLDHLRVLLAPGGTLLATVPLGYNPWLDEQIRNDTLPWTARFLRRTGGVRWEQCTREEIAGARYGSPYPRANALAVTTLQAG